MKKTFIIMAVVLMALTGNAFAKDLKVGTGGPTGSYYGMALDIKDYCEEELGLDKKGNPILLDVQNSDGSIANLGGMNNKKYAVGMVQEDVLQFMAKKDPNVNQNRIKIISGMHSETIHLLIPKDFKPEGGNMFSSFMDSFSSDKPIDINLLKDQTIGSWGGSLVSAQALSYFMGLNWKIQELPEKSRETANMPLIVVAGQPSKTVENYLATGRFHLIGINYDAIRTQAPFYLKALANYGKSSTVDTIAVRALLLGKAFRKESKNAVMTNLASCIDVNLPDLADDSDTDPNWESVYEFNEAGAQTNWSYFKLN